MLDPHGRKSVIETAKKLNKEEGITVILITHYMEEVIGADRIFVMDDGKLVMEGTPKEVFSKVEKLKELRLDVPQATLVLSLIHIWYIRMQQNRKLRRSIRWRKESAMAIMLVQRREKAVNFRNSGSSTIRSQSPFYVW